MESNTDALQLFIMLLGPRSVLHFSNKKRAPYCYSCSSLPINLKYLMHTIIQTLVDMPNTKKSDLRRARSGMLNLAPTSTGSATAIIEIYPELKGKLNGLAIRVPLLNGSITDCVFEVEKEVTAEEVNAALKKASESGPLKGILGYEEKPLVSTDYTGDIRSSIIDAMSTQVIDKTMVKIYAWYDNECGYSKRMAELCNIVAAKYITGTEPGFKYE